MLPIGRPAHVAVKHKVARPIHDERAPVRAVDVGVVLQHVVVMSVHHRDAELGKVPGDRQLLRARFALVLVAPVHRDHNRQRGVRDEAPQIADVPRRNRVRVQRGAHRHCLSRDSAHGRNSAVGEEADTHAVGQRVDHWRLREAQRLATVDAGVAHAHQRQPLECQLDALYAVVSHVVVGQRHNVHARVPQRDRTRDAPPQRDALDDGVRGERLGLLLRYERRFEVRKRDVGGGQDAPDAVEHVRRAAHVPRWRRSQCPSRTTHRPQRRRPRQSCRWRTRPRASTPCSESCPHPLGSTRHSGRVRERVAGPS
eukprot:Opistho-1_new@89995